jgi:hypothetical protein
VPFHPFHTKKSPIRRRFGLAPHGERGWAGWRMWRQYRLQCSVGCTCFGWLSSAACRRYSDPHSVRRKQKMAERRLIGLWRPEGPAKTLGPISAYGTLLAIKPQPKTFKSGAFSRRLRQAPGRCVFPWAAPGAASCGTWRMLRMRPPAAPNGHSWRFRAVLA